MNCFSCDFNVLVICLGLVILYKCVQKFGINFAPLISHPVTETDWREGIVNVIVRGDTHVVERGKGSAGGDHAGKWLNAQFYQLPFIVQQAT